MRSVVLTFSRVTHDVFDYFHADHSAVRILYEREKLAWDSLYARIDASRRLVGVLWRVAIST